MKTNNGGFRLLYDLGHCGVERRAPRSEFRGGRVEGGFRVIRRELIESPRLPLGIRSWRHVTEEIDVEWRTRSSPNLGDLIAKLCRRQHRSRQ